MGLKDLTSQLDLVGGTDPVGNMNAQQGPQFQLPIPDASQVHVDSLQDVPGFSSNSPFQDLDGVPDPNFNTLNGTSDSPFNSRNGTGDHMVDLLTTSVQSKNSGMTYLPSPRLGVPPNHFQDLHPGATDHFSGQPTNPNLGQFGGPYISNGPCTTGGGFC